MKYSIDKIMKKKIVEGRNNIIPLELLTLFILNKHKQEQAFQNIYKT